VGTPRARSGSVLGQIEVMERSFGGQAAKRYCWLRKYMVYLANSQLDNLEVGSVIVGTRCHHPADHNYASSSGPYQMRQYWVPGPLGIWSAALLPLRSSQPIELPFDIIDIIFSQLRRHPGSLVACSNAHPVFSRIAERHLYYHIIIHTGVTHFAYSLGPSVLNKLLSETPRIAKYIRVLQIEFNYLDEGLLPRRMMSPYLEQIAPMLSMFTALECIMLPSLSDYPVSRREDLPRSFRRAMEGCFRLPTLQEVHLGNINFPLYLLENNPNITSLSLFGSPEIAHLAEVTYPQFATLSVEGMRGYYDKTLIRWVKQHIVGLRALKCVCPYDKGFLELFVTTLNNLDLSITRESPCELSYRFQDLTSYSIP
jgi:hypothetical protein